MLNVSIIIPAWNEEERIADCLMNATRQTVAPHEVIVVNNRSTDRTPATSSNSSSATIPKLRSSCCSRTRIKD